MKQKLEIFIFVLFVFIIVVSIINVAMQCIGLLLFNQSLVALGSKCFEIAYVSAAIAGLICVGYSYLTKK